MVVLRPAVGTIVFVLLVPGSVVGIVPWLLSRWRLEAPLLGWTGFRWVGIALFLFGMPVLGEAMVRFVREGRGTPAPILPTERLVAAGLYRHVRNPMYIGVVSMILGQGFFFGSRAVTLYAACAAVAFHLFVRLYEEPTLHARFGAEYDTYTRQVPRWRPRLTPWVSGGPTEGPEPGLECKSGRGIGEA